MARGGRGRGDAVHGEREEAGQHFHKGYLRPLLFGCSSTVPGRQSARSGGMMKRQSCPHEKWATYSSSDSEAVGGRWRDFRASPRTDLADVFFF